MKIVQASKAISSSWQYKGNHKEQLSNPLVLIFADRKLLQDPEILEEIREEFPYRHLIFGSSAGEIIGQR